MKSIGEVLQLSTSFLTDRKEARARRSAEELLAHVLRLKRMDLYLQFDRPVEEKELVLLRELLKKRAKGEPTEYLLGEVDFLDCPIRIDRRVLIPRPETEILAAHVKKMLSEKDLEGKQLWDVCTGSGCIGLSLKKAFPQLSVVLSDLSQGALDVARANGELNGVSVEILQGDLLQPFKGRKADFFICNPPYVSQKEFLDLDPSVRDFEPREALIGGETGAEFYERLSRELPEFLNPGALVFFEIGSGQGEILKQLFSKGSWTRFELLNDWAGHSRFFLLEKQ
jgi:release factor glutamine methyltransferase